MQRVNEYRFYDLGQKLAAISTIEYETTAAIAFWPLWEAREAVRALLTDPVPLRICRPLAQRLVQALDSYLPQDLIQAVNEVLRPNQAIGYQASTISMALKAFEPVLSAECDSIDTYVVSRKGIYSTSELIESADDALPSEAREVLPTGAILDLREAGRCLAFDADTACGFHLMRATESVIHEYYVAVTGHTPKRKDRNWGAYVRNLNAHRKSHPESKADPKLIALLDQIREHHRNVLIHPEETLSPEEALTLFGICQSAIVAFANGLRTARSKE